MSTFVIWAAWAHGVRTVVDLRDAGEGEPDRPLYFPAMLAEHPQLVARDEWIRTGSGAAVST